MTADNVGACALLHLGAHACVEDHTTMSEKEIVKMWLKPDLWNVYNVDGCMMHEYVCLVFIA